MTPWMKVAVIGGSVIVGGGIAYGSYRHFQSVAQPPSGGGGGTGGGGTSTGSGQVWRLPQELTGNQIASLLGVSFAALKAANPTATYMIAHPNALLKIGTKIDVPAGGTIPASIQAGAGGGSSAVPAA